MSDRIEDGRLGGTFPGREPEEAPDAGGYRRVLTEDWVFEDGSRVGRYVTVRDTDGCLVAVTATAVSAVYECDDGCVLLLPGGRMLKSTHSFGRMLAWLT